MRINMKRRAVELIRFIEENGLASDNAIEAMIAAQAVIETGVCPHVWVGSRCHICTVEKP